MVDPCFIHCHLFSEKVFFAALKQLRTMIWIVGTSLFLIDCKQTQHPLWTQLSHWQMFMKNGAFWYLQLFIYLAQLQFTIALNELVKCFGVFRDDCRILATWAFSIIFVCTTAFKVSVPNFNRFYQVIALLDQYFSLQRTKFRFSIDLKICNCSFT